MIKHKDKRKIFQKHSLLLIYTIFSKEISSYYFGPVFKVHDV